MLGWVGFGGVVVVGIFLLLLKTYTEANWRKMREQQERNEREITESMRQMARLEGPLLDQAIEEWRRRNQAGLSNNHPRIVPPERPRQVIEVRRNGVCRRYSISRYGEVFEER